MIFDRLVPAGRPAVSLSIEAVVSDRLRALAPDARSVLELAALLVREIDASLIAEALETSSRRVARALASACAAQFLAPSRDGLPPSRFAHALIRAAIRTEIPFERLPGLHARLARALERRPDADLRAHELAHYWWAAGEADKSRFYDECSGDAALTVNAFADAATHYRRALAAGTPGDDERKRLAMKLEKSLAYEGEVRTGS